MSGLIRYVAVTLENAVWLFFLGVLILLLGVIGMAAILSSYSFSRGFVLAKNLMKGLRNGAAESDSRSN